MQVSMNIKALAGIIVFILVVALAVVAFSLHKGSPTQSINTSTASAQPSGTSLSNQTNASSSKVLFASSQYAPYSYLVYPGPISQQAQLALSVFNITATSLQNGSTEIKLSIFGTNQSKTIILGPNYKLYIVDASLADDGFRSDYSLSDDGFVVVDPNGYAVGYITPP